MKKFLITMTIICGLFTGRSCYKTNISEESIGVGGQNGKFTILEYEGRYSDEVGMTHYQYLVYDKDTYIIYIYEVCSGFYKGATSISPYYCMNADNEPEIAVYWDGTEE